MAWILEAALDVSLLAFAAMCALVMATPFETRTAVFALPFQQFTLTEVVWMVAAAAFVAWHVAQRRLPNWRTPVTWPWVVWMTLMVLAAMSADADRVNALKTSGRLIVFGLTALMVASSITSERRMVTVLAIAAGTGIVVATLAVLEVWRVPTVMTGLDAFRDGVRTVGGQVRASSTLQYPTITAMYLELVFCGALGVLLWIGDKRGWRSASILAAGLLAIIAGLSLTLTRAAMLAGLSGVMLAAWWRYRQRGLDRGFVLVTACAVCLAGAPFLFGSWEVARARWTTDGRQGWYRASFDAPTQIAGQPGDVITVPIVVTNHGRITWDADADPPFHISYHWVEASSTRVVVFDGARTKLLEDVRPGTSATIQAQVRFPRTAGAYRIAWDVVQEGRLWFMGEPDAQTTFTRASVGGAFVHPPVEERGAARRAPSEIVAPSVVPGRPVLWNAAMRMAADHPWLGVGPDNFRLRYGSYLSLPEPDTRVHSNNLYLEVLTGGGFFAAGAFLWFLWRVTAVVRAEGRRLPGPTAGVYSGVAAAGLAYLTHGFLDSFLTFTPTAFASAVILGLAIAPVHWRS